MSKSRRIKIGLSTMGLLVAALVLVKVTVVRQPSVVRAEEPSDVLQLRGILRDFKSDHPDFGDLTSTHLGHCVQMVDAILGEANRPSYAGSGLDVASQWYDRHHNPIRPYSAERGLPGGHFDVDVFNKATNKQLWHKHQFDDAYDVTYVDLVNDDKLLFGDIIGSGYPGDLRLVLLNPHHGSGFYTFEAGGTLQSGPVREGLEITFDPSELTQLRLDFQALAELRGTQPGVVQKDVADRDDALAIRMYDVHSNALVYELAVYHHTKRGSTSGDSSGSVHVTGRDACNQPIDDIIGRFGGSCDGGITDAASFNQWFADALGVNISTIHTIELRRDATGVYEFLTDEFWPGDGRLHGNEGAAHNSFFTYMIPATFTYDACAGLFFEFQGNDDCWVFIDGRMVIDLGGAGTPERQYVALDRLNLVDGTVYGFHFFFAHRRNAPFSVFRMRTNIPLQSSVRLPVSGGYD